MTTATSKGGPFGRFGPFKFLSGAKNSIMDLGSDKKRKKQEQALSEASTDTYEGESSTSSCVSMDTQGADNMVIQPTVEQVISASPPSTAAMMVENPTPLVLNSRLVSGYEVLDTLGKGMSGKVKRGRCPQTGNTVALKIIDKAAVPRRVLMLLNTEIQAMKTLQSHPNILTLLHYDGAAVYPKKNGGFRDVVCLALELAPGGELFDYLMYTGAFSEEISKAMFIQLASALAFCHAHNIYHRDIKPENLLLDENYQLKLADFGLAAVRADPQTLLQTECGTRSYMAPEVLARLQYDGARADCWSAAVVLFIMLSGNPPFQMARPGDWWFNQIQSGRYDKFWASHLRYNPSFPRGGQQLLSRMFVAHPQARPTVRDVLSDPWLTSCSLTPLDIKREFERRREVAAQAKAVEMEKARQKKAAGQHGDHTKEFNPESHKNRDIPQGDMETINVRQSEVEVRAPMASDKVLSASYMTNLYSAESALYCLKRLRETVALMGAEIVTKASEEESRFKMVAVVPADAMNNKVEVEIRLWSVPEGDITLIQVQRKGGDLLAFHAAFNKLREETKDLHGHDDGVEAGRDRLSFMKRQSTMPEPVESDEEVDTQAQADGPKSPVLRLESLLAEDNMDMI